MKKITKTCFILCMVFLFGTVCFAYPYYTTYSNWTSADGSYSPSSGSLRTDSYDSSPDHLSAQAYYIRYSSSAITAITNRYNQIPRQFPGVDYTEINSSNLDCNGWYSTNYPNPKFDMDDDDGDGKNEETEITCRSPLQMNSSTDYFYSVDFDDATSGSCSGTLAFTAQESINMITEYNVVAYDELDQISYQMP